MTKTSKPWGETRRIATTPLLEIDRIVIEKGGVCSEHIHQFKINAFFVESGELLIREWDEKNLKREFVLTAGAYHEVQPNVHHQFEALTKVIAFEFYYPKLVGPDIVRRTEGYRAT